MSGDTEPGGSQGREQAFNVVAVPEHLTQQVLEYVQSLVDEEAETSGYMIGGLGMTTFGSGALLDGGGYVGTNCGHKATKGVPHPDIYCND